MPTDPTPLLEQVRYLLCDADGNLFPSEEPAFDASVEVTNAFLAAIGSHRRFTAEELRLASTGMNFRTTALRLAAEAGVDDVDIEPWVAEEKRAVSAHLARTLQPHDPVAGASVGAARKTPRRDASPDPRAAPRQYREECAAMKTPAQNEPNPCRPRHFKPGPCGPARPTSPCAVLRSPGGHCGPRLARSAGTRWPAEHAIFRPVAADPYRI